jgi:hypothetical protein
VEELDPIQREQERGGRAPREQRAAEEREIGLHEGEGDRGQIEQSAGAAAARRRARDGEEEMERERRQEKPRQLVAEEDPDADRVDRKTGEKGENGERDTRRRATVRRRQSVCNPMRCRSRSGNQRGQGRSTSTGGRR